MDIGTLLSLSTVLLFAIEANVIVWLVRFRRNVGGGGPGTRLLSIIIWTIAFLIVAQLFDVLRDIRLDAAEMTEFRVGQILLGIGDMAFTLIAIIWAAWGISRLPVDVNDQSAPRQSPQLAERVGEEVDRMTVAAGAPVDEDHADTAGGADGHGTSPPVQTESGA